MATNLYDPIKTMAKVTDSVIVGFSTGKESIVTLDLCFKFFKKVQPYFLYSVPNVSFQEKTLNWYENKYQTEIIRIPGTNVSEFFHYGSFRNGDPTFPIVSIGDIHHYVRLKYDIWWIACGERMDDSIQRRAMIKNQSTIYEKGGRFYPVASWKKQEIYDYIKHEKLYLGVDSKKLGHSIRMLHPDGLKFLKENYPDDLRKLLHIYPFAGASLKREEMLNEKQVSGV